jgi:hypothetical protein
LAVYPSLFSRLERGCLSNTHLIVVSAAAGSKIFQDPTALCAAKFSRRSASDWLCFEESLHAQIGFV